MYYPNMPTDLNLREVPIVASPIIIDEFGNHRYTHSINQKIVVPCFIPGNEAYLGEDGHAYVNFVEIASVYSSQQALWEAACEEASYLTNSSKTKLIVEEARRLLASMEWWYCGC